MPIFYPKKIRRKFVSLNLEKIKASLTKQGYEFIRDGGFRPEDEPFTFCNYLFYKHPQTKVAVRVGYNYPLFGKKNVIFEICYAGIKDTSWNDVTPNFSKNCWKEISDWYIKDKTGKFVKNNNNYDNN